MKPVLTVAIAVLAVCGLPAAESATNYHVAREVAISGDEGWDYLYADSAAGRLYVTHGTKVHVLKLADLTPVGEIGDTPGVHGVAVAPDFGQGYISAGRSDSIVVFDLKSLARLQEIKSGGGNPDAILYDPATHQVFSFNGRGHDATVIDVKTSAVVTSIALDSKPEFGVTDLAGRVYVNLEDANSIAVIDAGKRSLLETWPLAGCEEPSGLAMDRAHQRLFAVCSNKVMVVVDAGSGSVVATLPIGGRVDGVAFDAGTQLAFASGGDGTLTIVHEDTPDRFSVAQTVATRAGARTLAVDEKTHRVYTVTAKYGPAPETGAQPAGRPKIVPGTFTVVELDP